MCDLKISFGQLQYQTDNSHFVAAIRSAMIVNNQKDSNEAGLNIRTDPFTDVYEVHSEIGRGKYAVVKRCVHRTTGVNYAAKFLHKRRRGRDCRHEALHEVHMLELTKSNCRIINLVEVFETSHDLVLITEYVGGGELFQHIDVEGRVDEQCTIRLMRQILEGIDFLHTNNILHLDVKPQNILLTESLPDGDVKLCDLGLARPFNSGNDVIELVGTLDYVAPEVLDYVSLDSSCDMWSVGVLAYVMLTGCSPFAGETRQETLLNISQVNLDFPADLFESISPLAVDFIQHLLVKNTRKRMTARDCLQHAWLNDLDNNPIDTTLAISTCLPTATSCTNTPIDNHKASLLAAPVPLIVPSTLTTLAAPSLAPARCCRMPSLTDLPSGAAVTLVQSPAASPSLTPRCCRSTSSTDSPSGQRRTLVATLNIDEVMTTHEPAKKCRCEVIEGDDEDGDIVDVDDNIQLTSTSNNNNNYNNTHHHNDNVVVVVSDHCCRVNEGKENDFVGHSRNKLSHTQTSETVRVTDVLSTCAETIVCSVSETLTTATSNSFLAACVDVSVA